MNTFKHTAPAGDPQGDSQFVTTGLSTIGVDDGSHRVIQYLFATVVYGLSLLIATPFFAVLFAPFYMGNF